MIRKSCLFRCGVCCVFLLSQCGGISTSQLRDLPRHSQPGSFQSSTSLQHPPENNEEGGAGRSCCQSVCCTTSGSPVTLPAPHSRVPMSPGSAGSRMTFPQLLTACQALNVPQHPGGTCATGQDGSGHSKTQPGALGMGSLGSLKNWVLFSAATGALFPGMLFLSPRALSSLSNLPLPQQGVGGNILGESQAFQQKNPGMAWVRRDLTDQLIPTLFP